jgi:parallel beta-helix repeat protein
MLILAIPFAGSSVADDDVPDFIRRDRIQIVGDEYLISDNGIISGNGTKDDPYIMSRWWINVSEGSGIILENISSHLLIFEVAVTHSLITSDPANVSGSGILIRNCSNIMIERSYIYYFNVGLEVVGSRNISVHDSSFIENHNGIMMEAPGSSITGCICSYNTRFGVFINNSNGLVIRDVLTDANSFTMGEGAGIQLINCSDIIMEECFGTLNYGEGISVIGSLNGDSRGRDLVIRDCYSDSNVNGIQIIDMDRIRISGTRLRYNSYGINLVHVTDARINGSTFYKNYFGFIGFDLRRSLVDDNHFQSNDLGLKLDTSYGNRIIDNLFENTSKETIRVISVREEEQDEDSNVITSNIFSEGEEDFFDGSGTVEWSEDGRGNFWSDWQRSDSDGDGVVDDGREIRGGAVDPHPLLLDAGPEPVTDSIPVDDNDEKSMEYWIIVSISAVATMVLGVMILYNRRSSKG